MNILLTILIALVALAVGWFAATTVSKRRHRLLQSSREEILQAAVREGETLKREKILEAKDEWYRRKEKFEENAQKRKAELSRQQQQLREKEAQLARIQDEQTRLGNDLKVRNAKLEKWEIQLKEKLAEVDRVLQEENRTLEQIAGLTEDQAREKLFSNLLKDVKREAASTFNEIKEHAKLHAYQEARRILVSAIQRTSIELSRETTVTTVELSSDDIKGRIIGRDGRNIRSFENATGVEIIVDDTPQKVTISSFDPFRREVARVALEDLLADGRIHPARIEEVVEKVRSEIVEQAAEEGAQALYSLGIHGMNKELVRLIGRLRFHNIMGQNLLKHSLEVAGLAGLIGSELDLDVRILKRAGILHDIGLVVPDVSENDHAELGADIARKYQESESVVTAIRNHQNRENTEDVFGQIIYIANQISIARPGVRTEELGRFVKRLRHMEEIAREVGGIKEAYALQAGREVRVLVNHEDVPDDRLQPLADDIATRIRRRLRYPGQVKVTVMREFRAVDFAK